MTNAFVCSVPGCDKTQRTRVCGMHRERMRRNGTYDRLPAPTLAERFWVKVDRTGDGCWPWTAATYRNGYGKIGIEGRGTVSAHRLAYELAVGPIPDGLVVMHSCDNKRCCRPDHLSIGTHSQNTADAVTRGLLTPYVAPLKTHCLRGHAYDEANTYVSPAGRRACRSCHRMWAAQR